MNIDEAIAHAEGNAGNETECQCEHHQLAEWLPELKVLRGVEQERDSLKEALEELKEKLVSTEQRLQRRMEDIQEQAKRYVTLESNCQAVAAQNEALRSALQEYRRLVFDAREAFGPCDHSVGICNCDMDRSISDSDAALNIPKGYADEIEYLKQERDKLIQAVADHVTARCELAAQNEALRSALQDAVASCFDSYSHKQVMSDPKFFVNKALNLPNLAAEILRKRDAATLRRAAERLRCEFYEHAAADVLRMAADIEKETT